VCISYISLPARRPFTIGATRGSDKCDDESNDEVPSALFFTASLKRERTIDKRKGAVRTRPIVPTTREAALRRV